MNWQAISAITEIIGTIFILVSLLYLAIQIKSNTKEVQTENIHRVTDSFNSLNLQIASDERLAQLWQKAFHDYENLSEIEMTQINLLWLSAFRIYDSLYHQIKKWHYG